MRTEYGYGVTMIMTRILSATAKSITESKSELAVSRARLIRDRCLIGPASSSPCHHWFHKLTKGAVTRGQCTHWRTREVKNFAASGTRRRFSKSGTMTKKSRGYLNDKQRQMELENYLPSGKIILQNIIRGLTSKSWSRNNGYLGNRNFDCGH